MRPIIQPFTKKIQQPDRPDSLCQQGPKFCSPSYFPGTPGKKGKSGKKGGNAGTPGKKCYYTLYSLSVLLQLILEIRQPTDKLSYLLADN